MDRDAIQEKLSSIKPYTFYGDDPPRRLSKDPSKILRPLMEWAEKTHFKKGGLLGRKLERYMPPAPKRPRGAYRFFFDDTKKKLLAQGGKFTRDEIQTVAPMAKKLWLEASAETLDHYRSLAKDDTDRYQKDMEEYESTFPECARQLRIKQHQRKIKARRTRELKRGGGGNSSQQSSSEDIARHTRASGPAKNKVIKWLDDLNDSNLQSSLKDDSSNATSDSEMEDDEDNGFSGAYSLP